MERGPKELSRSRQGRATQATIDSGKQTASAEVISALYWSSMRAARDGFAVACSERVCEMALYAVFMADPMDLG